MYTVLYARYASVHAWPNACTHGQFGGSAESQHYACAFENMFVLHQESYVSIVGFILAAEMCCQSLDPRNHHNCQKSISQSLLKKRRTSSNLHLISTSLFAIFNFQQICMKFEQFLICIPYAQILIFRVMSRI